MDQNQNHSNKNLRNLNIPTFGEDLTNLSARNTYRDVPSDRLTLNLGDVKNSASRQSHQGVTNALDISLSSRL